MNCCYVRDNPRVRGAGAQCGSEMTRQREGGPGKALRVDHRYDQRCAHCDRQQNPLTHALGARRFKPQAPSQHSTDEPGCGLANCVSDRVRKAHSALRLSMTIRNPNARLANHLEPCLAYRDLLNESCACTSPSTPAPHLYWSGRTARLDRTSPAPLCRPRKTVRLQGRLLIPMWVKNEQAPGFTRPPKPAQSFSDCWRPGSDIVLTRA